jgi:hypothetical protein
MSFAFAKSPRNSSHKARCRRRVAEEAAGEILKQVQDDRVEKF